MEPLTSEDPEQIAGYRLGARLGAGGMGRVYLAFTAGGHPVALKVIRPELGDDQDFRDRFRQEVEAARRVHGLYTAQVLDADPAASSPWLVTTYVPGPSLQDAVSAHGPLSVGTALQMMAGVAEALQAIHAAGIIHRDLKPSNVLLAADGPRVIDFGIARAIEATTMTRTGLRMGSPPFMAPEQVEGLPVSPATDVFALGSVVAYAVLGRLPFGDGIEHAMFYRVVHQAPDLDGCPEPPRALIERCLAKVPEQRPSPAEIIDECRLHTALQTLQLSETWLLAPSWLPAAVSTGLAQPTMPSLQRTVTTGLPYAGLGSTDPGCLVQAGANGATPPGPYGMPYGPGATSCADGGTPFPGPVAPGPAAPPDETRNGPARPAGPGRIIRKPLVAGLALVAVAGTGAGLTVLLSPGGTSGGPGDQAAKGAATASPPATASRGAALGRSTASASASPPPNSAACVTGTWKAVDQQVISTVNGRPVVFTGSGAVLTFLPDGKITTTYNNAVYSANVNSVKWTETIEGAATGHWGIENGDILYSDLTSSGIEVLEDNGAYDNSGPLRALPGAVPYQCSGNILRESFLAGGSDQLTRVSPS